MPLGPPAPWEPLGSQSAVSLCTLVCVVAPMGQALPQWSSKLQISGAGPSGSPFVPEAPPLVPEAVLAWISAVFPVVGDGVPLHCEGASSLREATAGKMLETLRLAQPSCEGTWDM